MAKGSVGRRGSTWSYVIDVGIDPATGRRRQEKRGGFRTRKQAEAALREVVAQVDGGAFLGRSRLTLGEYLDQWLNTVEARLRPTTWSSYEAAVGRAEEALGAVKLQDLKPLQIEAFYAELGRTGGRLGRGLSPKSVRNTHVALRKALADAERLGLVNRNAAAAARPPSMPATERQIWTAAEVRRFLDHVSGERLEAAFVLLATTGMRRGEVLGLEWGSVDLVRSRLAIVQTISTVKERVVVGSPKSARSRRNVALDPTTVTSLRARRRQQAEERLAAGELWDTDSKLVFADELGGVIHPSRFSAKFVRQVRKAGLPPIRMHDLRHTYATLALAGGIHPKVLSERLGHATVGVTLDLYSHVTPALDAMAAEQVANQIFGDQPPT